ncbi:MAG: hypothetical protein ABR584_03405 [Candidatus Baltobacteraceae bacterium]
MKNISALLLTAFAATVLSACGGGGGSAIPPSVLQGSGGRAAASLVITIPAASQSSARQPKYVSPNTQSVTISSSSALSAPSGSPCTGTGNSLTCNTTGTSSGCTSAGGTLTCTFNLIAQVGSDSFTLTMFSGTNGTGSTLSSGTVSANVSATGPNNIPVTLSGVVDSVSVALASSSPATGASVTIPVTVTAKDPSGATILGPGTYNNPITLTNSDTSGATTLSTTSVPAPGTAVTLTYNGSASLTSATIGATVPGVASSKITGATLTPASAAKQISGGTSALAILTINGTTYAFVPSGTGVIELPIAGGGQIANTMRRTMSGGAGITVTPAPQECAADPLNAKLYCINFNSAVINVLDASSVPASVISTYTTDAPTGGVSFSGATCIICGISFDAADNVAVFSSGKGYEFFNYKNSTITNTISGSVAENFGYNAVTNQIWSPTYAGGNTMDLVDVKSAKRYTLSPLPSTLAEPDAGGVDNSTNIAIAPEEQAGATSTLYLLPLGSAQLGQPDATHFTDPVVTATINSSIGSMNGRLLDAMAVDSQGHLAFFADEFNHSIGAAQLPSSGSGTPALGNYMFAELPTTPDGQTWNSAGDPHSVAAFNLPNVCADCAALFNSNYYGSSGATYVAIVDMTKLLAAKADSTDPHLVASNVDLICSGIVFFIATDATQNGNSGCAASSFTTNASGGAFTSPNAAGFVVNGGYGANNGGVPLSLTASTEPPAGVSIPSGSSGTPVLYLSLTPSADLMFATTGQGYMISTVTVPAWFPTGKAYNYYAFDLTTGTYCGSSGTGTLSGSTITFASGGSGPSGSTSGSGCIDGTNRTTPKNHQMAAILTYQ